MKIAVIGTGIAGKLLALCEERSGLRIDEKLGRAA
jgi:hypothetical protein